MPNSSHFTLPDALFDTSMVSAAQQTIADFKRKTYDLHLQMAAFELWELFTDEPRLMGFTCELNYDSNDEGGTSIYISPRNIQLQEVADGGDEQDADEVDAVKEEMHDAIGDFSCSISDNILKSFRNKTFTRPTENTPDALLTCMMEAVLGSSRFAQWQKSLLSHTTPEAEAESPKAKAISL